MLDDRSLIPPIKGPLSIASGNLGCFLPLRVIAPDSFEKIAASYEAQDPAAYLPNNSHPTLVAGYKAQKAALAAAMRSHNTGFYNLFLHGGPEEGSIVDVHPISRGTVHINPQDPIFSEPVVDYRALTNPADLDILVEFTKFTRRYFATKALAPFQPVEIQPGTSVTTDAQIRAFVRNSVSASTFHPVGTCAMMPLELGGVVCQDLLVHGVKKLSIIDASIIPTIPGAYTQQTVYAIAEKVSLR